MVWFVAFLAVETSVLLFMIHSRAREIVESVSGEEAENPDEPLSKYTFSYYMSCAQSRS